MKQFGNPNSLTTEGPHDFLALNEEKQSRDKYGWTYFVRG